MTQTKGEYRVGIDLASNPTDNTIFAQIKAQAAALIDLIETITSGEQEVARLKALAQTEIESAAMWACKAAAKPAHSTGKYDEMPMSAPVAPSDDPFLSAVSEAVTNIMGTVGPWFEPMPTSRMMAVMRRLEQRGFSGLTIGDVQNTLEDIWLKQG